MEFFNWVCQQPVGLLYFTLKIQKQTLQKEREKREKREKQENVLKKNNQRPNLGDLIQWNDC